MSNLTAWERWELAAFDEASKAAATPKLQPKSQPEQQPAVVLPTAEELEQIREQARQEGYQSGYKEGQAKARDEAQKLASATAKLDAAFKDVEAGVAEELLALAVEIARQVVLGELTARPEVLLDVVREALAQLPHQHAAIYLNPDDASLARSYLGDQLTHAGHRIHENPKLKRGDCVLEAGGSHLDATVVTRWRRVLEGLGLESAWQPADEVVATKE